MRRAREAFEGWCSELAVELRALVIDPDLDVVRSRDRSYQDSAFVMTQGVVDGVEDGAVQRFAVAGDGGCSVSEDVYRSGQPDISFQRIDPSRPARVRHSRKPHLRRRQTTRTGRPSAVDDLVPKGSRAHLTRSGTTVGTGNASGTAVTLTVVLSRIKSGRYTLAVSERHATQKVALQVHVT